MVNICSMMRCSLYRQLAVCHLTLSGRGSFIAGSWRMCGSRAAVSSNIPVLLGTYLATCRMRLLGVRVRVRVRVSSVDRAHWEGLFEYVVYKLVLWLGADGVRPFLRELCGQERFDRLRIDSS